MTDVKEDVQQQMLFEELDTDSSIKDLPTKQAQVIFDNDDYQAKPEDVEYSDNLNQEKSNPNWLLRGMGVLFSTVIVVELVDFFTVGFQQSPWVASLYGALLAGVTVLCSTTAYKEFSSLRQFKKQRYFRDEAEKITTGESGTNAAALCEEISNKLPCDLVTEHQQQFHDIAKDELNDEELLSLYSRKVLSHVDEKALNEVATFSTEATVLVGLSPIAIADMLIMFWRNLRMIDKIAGLYGVRLGYFSRIRLIKQVFVNMAYAGASEIVTDLGANLLGVELLGKLSGKFAQGLGAGMLTARLGIKTIALCRPLAFEQQQPKLRDVRQRVVDQVKQLIKKEV